MQKFSDTNIEEKKFHYPCKYILFHSIQDFMDHDIDNKLVFF